MSPSVFKVLRVDVDGDLNTKKDGSFWLCGGASVCNQSVSIFSLFSLRRSNKKMRNLLLCVGRSLTRIPQFKRLKSIIEISVVVVQGIVKCCLTKLTIAVCRQFPRETLEGHR
jgi:hypothetical protein